MSFSWYVGAAAVAVVSALAGVGVGVIIKTFFLHTAPDFSTKAEKKKLKTDRADIAKEADERMASIAEAEKSDSPEDAMADLLNKRQS